MPILQAGSTFSSTGGGFYTLLDDVDYSSTEVQTVVGAADPTTGNPTSYVIRSRGRAISGRAATERITIGGFQRFRTVNLNTPNVSEIIRVVDSEGNEYFEVDNLSQNIFIRPLETQLRHEVRYQIY